MNWRTPILQEFTPQVARLTLVADPDGLLLEEGILQGIRERGFELIPFEDHVAFRFAYESGFRSRWDRGEHTDLVVVLRSDSNDLNSLPYDILQAGRKLSFNLGDLFPNLSYPVITALDRGDLDTLYKAQIQHNPGKLGDNATKDFILRHVFEIALELIKQPSDLLRVLLRRHYRGQCMPAMLDQRFIRILCQNGQFKEWPLEKIVPNRKAFFSFLQERWPAFLDRMGASGTDNLREADQTHYALKFKGPLAIPFDHDDVRVYVDNLFFEGLLQPVPHMKQDTFGGQWVEIGVQSDPQANHLRRLNGLIKSIKATLPAPDARHRELLLFAYRWAELIVIEKSLDQRGVGHTSNDGILTKKKIKELQKTLHELTTEIDSAFLDWVHNRYAGLHNQPAMPPVMLHHIPRALARETEGAKGEKIAFVLLDGLALDQWLVLRDVLLGQCPNLCFHEDAVFAWAPTVTSVSRQAAFAGKPPLYFPSSINATNKDANLWAQFWMDQGLAQNMVTYKGLYDENLGALEEILSRPALRVIGLVVNKVDKIMHCMELGTAGMHNQVRQWAQQGFMAKLITLLSEANFKIFIASDHGNIEARGCGRPSEGAVADLRGERVRIYPDQNLRAQIKGKFPEAIEWPTVGLPTNYLPLLASGRTAFIRKNECIVGHGGIAIEELIVPFIGIERKTP